MTCLLDNKQVMTLLEQFDEDSSNCIAVLDNMDMVEGYSRFRDTIPEVDTKVKDAKELLKQAQLAMDDAKDLMVAEDSTEYFEGNYFSNMGWLMVAQYVDGCIAIPSEFLKEYASWRTSETRKVSYGLNKLVRQGLLERKPVSVPTVVEGRFEERREICVMLTPLGRKMLESPSFIYSPGWPLVTTSSNVVPLRIRS